AQQPEDLTCPEFERHIIDGEPAGKAPREVLCGQRVSGHEDRCDTTATSAGIEFIAPRRHKQTAIRGEGETCGIDETRSLELHGPYLVPVLVVDKRIRHAQLHPKLTSSELGR